MVKTANEMELYRRELLKGGTETLLLSLLSEEPKYGYQLVREMDARSGGYFHLKEGTLYPALHRLELDGLVESTWWEEYRGGQRRCYYAMTRSGRARLESMINEWNLFADALNQIARPIVAVA